MANVMKGVKRGYDGIRVFFIYKGIKIVRIRYYFGRFGTSYNYRVDGNDYEFLSLTDAKDYIDRIKK